MRVVTGELGRGGHTLAREQWDAAVRLAVVLSLWAAPLAAIAAAVGAASTPLVLVVIAVGFTASWVRSGRIATAVRARVTDGHRVTVVATVPRVG